MLVGKFCHTIAFLLVVCMRKKNTYVLAGFGLF